MSLAHFQNTPHQLPDYSTSLLVDTEDHTSAEKRVVSVGEGGVVIVGFVPEALGGDAHALTSNLADNGLHNDFVGGDAKLLSSGLNLADDSLNPGLRLHLVVLLVADVAVNHILDNNLNFIGVESI